MTAGRRIFRFGTCEECCDDDAECLCEHCTGSGLCCAGVTVLGLRADSCNLCTTFNRTWNLRQQVTSSGEPCRWTCDMPTTNCGDVDVELTLGIEEGKYVSRFTIGSDMVWEWHGDTKPLCGQVAEFVPVSHGSLCDNTNSTVTVRFTTDTSSCICLECRQCPPGADGNHPSPSTYEVTIAGLVDQPGGLCVGRCGDADGTYIVEQHTNGCFYCINGLHQCDFFSTEFDRYMFGSLLLDIHRNGNNTEFAVAMATDLYGLSTVDPDTTCIPTSVRAVGTNRWLGVFNEDEVSDCRDVMNLKLPFLSQVLSPPFPAATLVCDSSNATCHITSGEVP